MSDKISIIIPVYNNDAHIEKCLTSLINQTYSFWEAICIDDGSVDTTPIILKKYKNKDPRIIVHTQKNLGVSAARNKGIELSTGKYLTFLDSDDTFETNALEELEQCVNRNKSDIINFVATKVTTQGSFIKYISDCKKNVKEETINDVSIMLERVSGFLWTKLIRKELITDHQIKFNPKVRYGEDLSFIWKCCSLAKNLTFLSIPLYKYVENPNSALSNLKNDVSKGIDYIITYQDITKHFIEYNILEKHFTTLLYSIENNLSWLFENNIIANSKRCLEEENYLYSLIVKNYFFKNKNNATNFRHLLLLYPHTNQFPFLIKIFNKFLHIVTTYFKIKK